MPPLTRPQWIAVMLVGVVTAVLTWTVLVGLQHLWQDHADHHLVLDLLRYNLQQGKIVPLAVQPVVAPAPPTPPAEKK